MKKQLLLIGLSLLLMTGCFYTDSALRYAEVQNNRVKSGYTTKENMTKEIMKAVAEMNKDCGVKVTMVNGMPITNVKQCIGMHEAMASVGQVEIQRAEGVQSVGDGAAKVLTSAATLAVPLGTAYMQYDAAKTSTNAQVKITQSNNDATVATNKSNNELQSNMINSYTTNFDKTNTTSTTSTSNTVNTATTTVADFSTDGNTTTVGN